MELRPDLIYDVGVNNGDDTAYYLFKGYRVLGIEADPVLIKELEQRFASDIARGALTLVNLALAPTRTVAPFYICEGYSLWNSFDRAVASRDGRTAREVEVQCWPLRELFAQYGVPHYVKLSLHGEEHFCLQDLTLEVGPKYISLELPRNVAQGDEVFARLSALRYEKCKIIDQTSMEQLVVAPPSLKSKVRRTLKRYPTLFGAAAGVVGAGKRMLGTNGAPVATARSEGGWKFPDGSSGPFGEETYGPWRRTVDAGADWRAFLAGRTGHDPSELSIWHDVHAVRETA